MYSKSAKENLKSQHAQQRNAKAFVKAETHHENYQQIPDKTKVQPNERLLLNTAMKENCEEDQKNIKLERRGCEYPVV